METQVYAARDKSTENKNRDQLLAAIPAVEHRLQLSGVDTAVLIGGDGPPVILLHGPGESSLWWMRVIPKLAKTHRVIVPDLPGQGESKVDSDSLDTNLIFRWLSELIANTCLAPPALVGNILGGSIGARFAIHHGKEIGKLVLVNSLGLGKFRPAPGFAFGLFRFIIWPTEKNFNRFFPQCMYDVGNLQNQMGELWEPFVAYNLECARDKERTDAMNFLMKKLGIPKIPSDQLDQIDVPTSLIWGRHDRANKLKIAEKSSRRFGWPLQIIEETRDDPKLERPEEFVRALNTALDTVN
ncbi:MAG: alpha/beta hydrolase [Gracilimonas sp.]|uniref:alpha/beta fold hydrolase n=1 Tax=Gracilimonas sp. TaxID=1974203 RepID=UPI0019A1BDE6|nr:alpha/beta hydrolase [Gracilimonas sp.]MBD3615248.1 alpha/beta hydrolase [Gracilimonas sp.]